MAVEGKSESSRDMATLAPGLRSLGELRPVILEGLLFISVGV